MPQEINIKTAELAVAHNDAILKTGSVGSCLVIALYDGEGRVGGMAHAMLPEKKPGTKSTSPAKYVSDAIDNLISELKGIGGHKEHMIAKLVGGATMFRRLSNERNSIGFLNAKMARETLAARGIKVEKEDTGGSSGKIVEFNLANGIVNITTKL